MCKMTDPWPWRITAQLFSVQNLWDGGNKFYQRSQTIKNGFASCGFMRCQSLSGNEKLATRHYAKTFTTKQLMWSLFSEFCSCWGGDVRKWVWSDVQTEQRAVVACVRLQLQNTKDELRGTTQTCKMKSYERSLRSGRAGVKVGEFSSQILLPQTIGRDETQCRGTIHNIF